MSDNQFDIIVIGAGSGGLTSAVGAAKAGKKVLLVEKGQLGGECTNVGCVPSKALIHRANQYTIAKKVSGDSEALEEFRQTSLDYARDTVAKFKAEETPQAFEAIGMTVIHGQAVFKDKWSVVVNDQIYYYQNAIIATGSPKHLSLIHISEPTRPY